jgi:hypothetical protein
MGKKTFEEIGKILLVSIISILISISATRRILLDSKLDKEDYKADQKTRWSEHDKQHDLENERDKETYNMVKFLYENAINEKKSNK